MTIAGGMLTGGGIYNTGTLTVSNRHFTCMAIPLSTAAAPYDNGNALTVSYQHLYQQLHWRRRAASPIYRRR